MDDVWIRLMVVAGAAGAAAVWAAVARRGIAFRRRPIELADVSGLILFTSKTCASCGRARAALDEMGADYRVVAYEDQPDLFGPGKVERVPAVASLQENGRGWVAEGVPARSRMRRWLGSSS